VLCSRRAYATGEDLGPGGVLDGVKVVRVSGTGLDARTYIGRMGEYLLYGASTLGRILSARDRPDAVLAMTTPPLLGLWPSLATGWRPSALVHWTMDVYPDALWAARGGPGPRLMRAPLEWLARRQFRHATTIIAAGPCMKTRVEQYLAPGSSAVSVPLWTTVEPPANGDAVDRLRRARGWQEDFVLMYSGNMGLAHGFSEFLEAAARLGPTGPLWAFMGGGQRLSEIEHFRQQHRDARIAIHAYVAPEEAAASLGTADVHLVSLRAGWSGIVIPSKLQSAFAAARPVIFVGPADSEAALWVRESGGGWVVGQGQVEALLEAVQAASDPSERRRRGEAALTYSRVHFDRAVNCGRIADLVEASVT
jgi:colanic acid biosynthesis glycosyl transferase WcaI